MRKLSILIPSYKRDSVLDTTLKGLLDNTIPDGNFDICIAVGLNKASIVEEGIINKYKKLFQDKGIPLNCLPYTENIGKARILNALFTLYGKYSSLVITMDNDMVITKPWLHYISQCDAIDYDLMGFSSAKFWAHEPLRDTCLYVNIGDLKFYSPSGVAGGMMLFHSDFLYRYPWTNYGGVYGRDDATMCLITNKKYVLGSTEDWLVHDPLNSSTPLLKEYEDKKKKLYANGITVFPIGWDE